MFDSPQFCFLIDMNYYKKCQSHFTRIYYFSLYFEIVNYTNNYKKTARFNTLKETLHCGAKIISTPFFCVLLWYISIIKNLLKNHLVLPTKKQTSINMKPEHSKHETSNKSLWSCIKQGFSNLGSPGGRKRVLGNISDKNSGYWL